MPQTHRVSRNNTKIIKEGNRTLIKFYQTVVVDFNDSEIVLFSGCHQTYSTKLRMNQVSNQFGLGYYVYQLRGCWFVSYEGDTIPFGYDPVILRRVRA